MKKLLMLFALIFVALLTLGAAQQTPAERHTGSGMPMMMQNCPMNLPGIDVVASDTPTGIDLTFTAKPENVAELQRRIERMAKHGMMTLGIIKYEAIDNGARLTLTPKDPATLEEFRAQVRAHVERMKKGECSTMSEMMHSEHK